MPPAPGRAFFVTLMTLTLLMNTIGRGVTETFAVFLLPVEQALQVSRSEISATYSIYMLVHGLAAPFAGQLVDRLGARVTYATGLILLGSAYVSASFAENIWHYYLTAGALSGLGAASLGMVVASSLLSRWFTRGLGAMMAIPYAAVGAGMLVIPPLSQYLLTFMTWREAHLTLGLGVLCLLPLIVLLPLGRMTRGSDEWREMRERATADGGRVWTASRAIRTGAFWALFGVYFFTSVAAYAVLPQSVAFLVERGFDPLLAAGAFGMTGALSAVGIIAIGWLSDRAGRVAAIVISKISTITGILCLLAIAWVKSDALLYAFVFFFGLMQGARGPVITVMVAILFRGGSVGTIFGTLSMALGLGAGLGSWASGALHDLTGSYVASFSFAAAASFTGLMCYVLSPSLRLERPAEL
ncbi:MAG: MFS transporter [Hyphomicrobiaceae bacterium]|nr:MFS transporter [Hyphomicrobiaceae bacterium]